MVSEKNNLVLIGKTKGKSKCLSAQVVKVCSVVSNAALTALSRIHRRSVDSLRQLSRFFSDWSFKPKYSPKNPSIKAIFAAVKEYLSSAIIYRLILTSKRLISCRHGALGHSAQSKCSFILSRVKGVYLNSKSSGNFVYRSWKWQFFSFPILLRLPPLAQRLTWNRSSSMRRTMSCFACLWFVSLPC